MVLHAEVAATVAAAADAPGDDVAAAAVKIRCDPRAGAPRWGAPITHMFYILFQHLFLDVN